MTYYWVFFGYLKYRCLKELGVSLDILGDSKRDTSKTSDSLNINQSVIVIFRPESQSVEQQNGVYDSLKNTQLSK